jgi:hydrogenase/urease accessory protein HupE
VAYLAGFSVVTLALKFAGRALGTLMQKTDNRVGASAGWCSCCDWSVASRRVKEAVRK